MNSLLIHILQSSIFLSVFYWGYKSLLSKETFFGFNRIVLLSGLIASFFLPLIEVERTSSSFFDPYFQTTSNYIEQAINKPAILQQNKTSEEITVSDILVTEVSIPTKTYMTNKEGANNLPNYISWGSILVLAYFLGIIINTILLTISYIQMKRMMKEGEAYEYGGIRYITIKKSIAPFTWRNQIIISESDKENINEILIHEKAHIQKKHYIDILLAEFILLLHWFNPFVWGIKRELRDIHEYQADSEVVNSGINKKKYQLLIIKKAVGPSSYALANSFNHSKIKKRITMMLKQKSKRWNQLKVLVLILCSGIFVYACSHAKGSNNTTDKTEIKQEITEQKRDEAKQKFTHPVGMNKAELTVISTAQHSSSGNQKGKTRTAFEVPDGTPVYAVLSGKVSLYAPKTDQYGGLIIIEHENGVSTVYGGCFASVKEGMEVKQGDKIGVVNGKARSNEDIKARTPLHLSFEVRKSGKIIDPEKIFDFGTQEMKIPLSEIEVSDENEDALTIVRFAPPKIAPNESKDTPPPLPTKATKATKDTVVKFSPPVVQG